MDYVTPKEWCVSVRELRRELTRLHRRLGQFDQNAIIEFDDVLRHMTRPLTKCEFVAYQTPEGRIFVQRQGKKCKKLSKRRIKKLQARNEELRQLYENNDEDW